MWKITIVEDDEGIRRELKEHFAGQGFAVTACEAWEDNEAKLKEADLILLDIQLGRCV